MTIFLDVSKIALYGLKCRWRIIPFLFAGNPFYSQISISLTGGNHGVWSLDARLIRAPSKKGYCWLFPSFLQIFIFEFFLKGEDPRFFDWKLEEKKLCRFLISPLKTFGCENENVKYNYINYRSFGGRGGRERLILTQD